MEVTFAGFASTMWMLSDWLWSTYALEAESEDVGKNFASEARAMHEGDSPIRSIYGEAKIKDAKSLIDAPFIRPKIRSLGGQSVS